jgi:hypothetical protein
MPMTEALAAGAGPASSPAPRSRACVLDPRLALSPLGLAAGARLAAECTVWIPRELREALKNPQAYRAHPRMLAPRVYGDQERALKPRDEEIRDALEQWSSALHGPLGSSRFCHLGEHPGESLLPGGVDSAVHERFERLAAGLDVAMRGESYDLPRGEAISACFRDTAALCAALSPYGAFVLTTLEADRRGAPALCNYLDAWGLPVIDVTARAGADAEVLRSVLARAGLGPVEWSGVHFVAVHIVPPGLGLEVANEEGALGLWLRTNVFWHRL